ncbi:DUF2490 domain-containing protein [Porifericola rhodea]|uniref:DUF2490 domain-containing protein n=1 Tax=Porifericola rhodea TaxID=930972 RepID=UPI002665B74A|nr:DUF2490 domain-containing protein [Porifericola rhodea]WKN30009.1 DUF2490 domain-containing protein [Porifericola rhodea]
MYYTNKRLILFISSLLFFAQYQSRAQSALKWEPEFSYTMGAFEHWSFNAKINGRNVWTEKDENSQRDYAWEQIETQIFADYEFFNESEFGIGYNYTWEGPFNTEVKGYEHRFMQQYAFVSFSGARRIAHRIRTEQHFQHDGFENRFRYRISYDFPLNGRLLDDGEKYIILSNEVLWSFNAIMHELNNRAYVGLGWFFNNKRKLETGIQYRLEGFNQAGAESIFHLVTSYYINQ